MINKVRNIHMSSGYAVVTLLICTVVFVYFQASFVFGTTTTTTILFPSQSSSTYKQQVVNYDKDKNCATDQNTPTTYKTYLTHFACGHVTTFSNGTTLRQFTLIVDDYHGVGKNVTITKQGLQFPAWTFNGTVPGPTLRMTQGDHVIVDVINSKSSALIHSWHVHSIHSGTVDGVMGNSGMIFPGLDFKYTFIANPYGIYPYHCHMAPVETHINRGLYGMMIIDPPYAEKRTPAFEMVMLMNGYSYGDLNNTVGGGGWIVDQGPPTPKQMANATERAKIIGENPPGNDVYSVNGMAFGYTGKDAIHLKVGQHVRIYLVNMLEFDPLNNFHLHGEMFHYIPTGTFEEPTMYTDIISLMQGDRGILEFAYHFPGEFMFHAHKNEFSRLGWQGFFNVTKS
jgi:manganese oxidase